MHRRRCDPRAQRMHATTVATVPTWSTTSISDLCGLLPTFSPTSTKLPQVVLVGATHRLGQLFPSLPWFCSPAASRHWRGERRDVTRLFAQNVIAIVGALQQEWRTNMVLGGVMREYCH